MSYAIHEMKVQWIAAAVSLLVGIAVVIAWFAFSNSPAKPSIDQSWSKQPSSNQSIALAPTANNPFIVIEEMLERRDVSSALKSLRDLEAAEGGLPRIQLLLADCFRHYRNAKKLNDCLELAERNGANEKSIRLVQSLAQTQAGMSEGDLSRQFQSLVDQGATNQDAVHALVLGCLYRRDFEQADQMLSEWEAKSIGSADTLALRGIYWQTKGDMVQSARFLELAIQSNPRNELAQMALLDNYELLSGSLTKSLRKVREVALEFPYNPQTPIRLARLLRKIGLDDEAAVVLNNIPIDDTNQELLRIELSELAFDQARYQDAQNQLAVMGLKSVDDYRRIIQQAYQFMLKHQPSHGDALFQRAYLGATAFALGGKRFEADEVFQNILGYTARIRRLNDLTNIQSVASGRQGIDKEKAELTSIDSPLHIRVSSFTGDGVKIYLKKCSHCHGENGAGDGRSARHLFPMPRNFGNERFRYISGTNGIATDSDLAKSIRLGLPGSSMPAFPELNAEEVNLLVSVLRGFQHQGWEARLRGHATSKLQLDAMVFARTKPTESLVAPNPPEDLEQAFRRGRLLFDTSGCSHCHGKNTNIDDVFPGKRLFDESGHPINSRDFRSDAFKGGESLNDIYYRLALGIPGTPHPSLSTSPPAMMDLAFFVKSIASGPQKPTNNYLRGSKLAE